MTKQKKFITCDGNQAAAHISYMFSDQSVIKLGIDYINNTKLNKLYKLFVNELMDRFEVPQLAYLEISNLIQSVEREDIINYFKLIGVDYNANK